MIIYDQHVHTWFSPDSSENIENYLMEAKKQGDIKFVTTEHLDLNANSANGEDIIPDFELLQETNAKMEKKYGIKMLFGIEAGYKASQHARVSEIVERYPFDVVIASVHENEEYDFYENKIYIGKTVQEVYEEYLDLLLYMVTNFKNYDILAHIDFPIRYTQKIEIAPFEESMKRIFKVLAEDDKALEMNTRTVDSLGMDYLEAYTKWFLESGGEYFSLGSDAHRVANYKGHFDETIEMLKRNGVKELSFYEKRERIGVLI